MIIRWPGKTEPGTVTDGLMSQIDIMATIAAIVGAELEPGTAEDSFDQRELWMGGFNALVGPRWRPRVLPAATQKSISFFNDF